MRIINVIVTRDGIVNEIESFAIADEQLSDEVVEQAEEAFREKIVSIRFDNHWAYFPKSVAKRLKDVQTEEADRLRDEINECWIDKGYYQVGDDVNTVVHLAWSNVENVQL